MGGGVKRPQKFARGGLPPSLAHVCPLPKTLWTCMHFLKDDFGLRSLVRNIATSSQPLSWYCLSSIMTREELGFTETVDRHFSKPFYEYVESPFTNAVARPFSESENIPEEYLHGLCARSDPLRLPPIQLTPERTKTDLVRKIFYFITLLKFEKRLKQD
jgi:hypothetical protein